jgi:AraC-like DNA-binding protein/ligand-binding sensor protein
MAKESAKTRTATDGPSDFLPQIRIYQDYQRAFTEASGLPLAVLAADEQPFVPPDKGESPFCALMAKTNGACAECLALQRRLKQEGQAEPKTLQCFAGLCESAAPVRVGDKLLAFLHTGHVLLHQPTHRELNRIARLLIQWGAEIDLKQLEDAYFHTRVLSPGQYQAFVRLLAVFAEHLAVCSNELLLRPKDTEPAAIERARMFIESHHAEELSLRRVALAANLSAAYFSQLFKKATGLSFVEYTTRLRVEKAKNLLHNPNLKVTTIALDVGFQSISQFNRAFKRLTGVSPRDFRARLADF